MSGSIVAFWPDGKIAANELPFTVDIVIGYNSRQIGEETNSDSADLSRKLEGCDTTLG
jgi:hypothetical protein